MRDKTVKLLTVFLKVPKFKPKFEACSKIWFDGCQKKGVGVGDFSLSRICLARLAIHQVSVPYCSWNWSNSCVVVGWWVVC